MLNFLCLTILRVLLGSEMCWVLFRHRLSRCDGLETKQKSLCYVFVGVYVNLCTVTVIELIVFSYIKEGTQFY